MGAWALTDNARMRRSKGNWNIDTATMKCALYLSTSNVGSSSTTYAAVTNEVTNANGYTTGGQSVDFAFVAVGATVEIRFVSNPAFGPATGSGFAARKAAIYESGGDVYAFKDLDTVDVTTTAGNTLTLDNDGFPNAVAIVS